VPIYARANPDTPNRTDVFARKLELPKRATAYAAQALAPARDASLDRRSAEHLRRMLEQRRAAR